jgi:hypothetical protein
VITITHEFASSGRNFGNKLFTYAVSKIISDTHGYALNVPEHSYIKRAGENILFPYFSNEGVKIESPDYYVSEHSIYQIGLDKVIEESYGKKTFMDGYFLKYDYVKNYKQKIKTLYSNLIGDSDNKNDVIILLRDSGIDPTFKIPDNYYLNILKDLDFDNLYVSIDHINKHQTLLSELSQYNPTILDLPILELFKIITTKKTIIGCQGTFSFWACWLSNAEKIYWPITTIGPNTIGHNYINLNVDDEERYVWINIDNNVV